MSGAITAAAGAISTAPILRLNLSSMEQDLDTVFRKVSEISTDKKINSDAKVRPKGVGRAKPHFHPQTKKCFSLWTISRSFWKTTSRNGKNQRCDFLGK